MLNLVLGLLAAGGTFFWMSRPSSPPSRSGSRFNGDGGLGIRVRDDRDRVETATALRRRFSGLGQGLALEIVALADHLRTDPLWLAELIHYESAGSFSPAVQNRGSKATGLIQFMPSTARALGTSVEELAQMNAVAQMAYVGAYFDQFGPPFDSRQRLFMTVFYPAARFWDLDQPFPPEVLAAGNAAATPRDYVEAVARYTPSSSS